jgi:hypothetical protein
VEWALQTRKQAIEGEVSVVMAGGDTWVGEGETASGNGLNAIDGGVA